MAENPIRAEGEARTQVKFDALMAQMHEMRDETRAMLRDQWIIGSALAVLLILSHVWFGLPPF